MTGRLWRAYRKGQSFNVALDAHPEWYDGVEDFAHFGEGVFTGFRVSAGEKRYIVLFNASDKPATLNFRFEGGEITSHEVKTYVSVPGIPSPGPISEMGLSEARVEVVPAYGTVCISY